MDRRYRLIAHLECAIDEVSHELPSGLNRHEQALYLQGTFFNTAVVQSSEATAHVLMMIATEPGGLHGVDQGQLDERWLDALFEQALSRYPLFGVAHRITTGDIRLGSTAIPAGSVLCFSYPEFHRAGGHIPFGVAANRPCPAWHLAPVTVKALTRELMTRFDFVSSASHTRPIPNRGPCLMTPRGANMAMRRPALLYVRLRDRWEDVWRSVIQLVLGTYMVWQARRLRPCARYFEERSA
jgi:hypothetical protein